MADLTEAPEFGKGFARRLLTALALVLCLVALTGCMRSHADPAVALRVDPATTSSITPLSADADLLSDEPVIAGVISGASDGRPLPWSNPDTGAAGVITEVTAAAQAGVDCKTFRTTRHGFDGIALYKGRACRLGDGQWHLQSFSRADG
jgi:hypothetical protein